MKSMNVDESIDCTGLCCPLPMIKTRRAIRGLVSGQVLELTATDVGVVPDVKHWVTQEGHELLQSVQRDDGVFHFLIRKSCP